jgi:hypothetical protein
MAPPASLAAARPQTARQASVVDSLWSSDPWATDALHASHSEEMYSLLARKRIQYQPAIDLALEEITTTVIDELRV